MLRAIKSLSLKNKMYIFLLPTIAMACLIIAVYFYTQLKSSLHEQMEKSMMSAAAQAETAVMNHLRTSQADADFYAATDAAINMVTGTDIETHLRSQKNVIALFAQLQRAKKQYQELYILDSMGNFIFSHSEDIFYEPKTDSRWLNTLYSDKKTAGDLIPKYKVVRAQLGNRLVVISPIKNKGERVGYVILSQDLRAFSAMAFEFSPTGEAKVAYRSNGLLLHEADDEVSQLLDMKNDNNEEKYKLDNTWWSTYTLPSEYGETIIFYDATSHVEKMETLKVHTVSITSIITASFVVMLWWIVKRIILNPLNQINILANEISEGNYNTKFPRKAGKDEIDALGLKIELMGKSIHSNNEKITELAYHDDLTTLANKQSFINKLSSYENTPETFTTWVIDLDKFKQINDIHGYEVGNEVLKAVSEVIKRSITSFSKRHELQSSTFMPARAGGDEFLIQAILPNAAMLPEAFARSLQKDINFPLKIDGREFEIHCFIGWEQAEGKTGFKTYQCADMAMHEAKNTNTRVLRFADELLTRVKKNQELSDNIKRALEMSEFSLYYQPKCEANAPFRVKEYEALIRWPTEKGFISPGVFIPFAEEANLIRAIDMWVCENTIKDVAHLEREGMDDFLVSFNVSGQRISDEEFVAQTRFWIDRYGIKPGHIQIEITEHSMIHDMKKSISAINIFREMGVGVALDDFGTGHSSLGYLKNMAIETLKIDRCFVQDVNKDPANQILLKHIIQMGHDMGLRLVAEGVETEAELAVLQNLNCDLIQGYLFHKPMPLKDVLKLVALEKSKQCA